MNRPLILVYRDCMKVASRISEEPARIQAVRYSFRHQFRQIRNETDEVKLLEFREGIVRFLSNFYLYSVKTELVKPNEKTIWETDSESDVEHGEEQDK